MLYRQQADEAAGCSIGVSSRLGEGTTFTLKLAAAIVSLQPVRAPVPATPVVARAGRISCRVFHKPVDAEELSTHIRSVLGSAAVRGFRSAFADTLD